MDFLWPYLRLLNESMAKIRFEVRTFWVAVQQLSHHSMLTGMKVLGSE